MKTVKRRAYSVAEFAKAHILGRTSIYTLIKKGKIRTVKLGGRRLIPAS